MDKERKEAIDRLILEMVDFEKRRVYSKIEDDLYKKIDMYQKLLHSKESRYILDSCYGNRWKRIYELRSHLWSKITLLYNIVGKIYEISKEDSSNNK